VETIITSNQRRRVTLWPPPSDTSNGEGARCDANLLRLFCDTWLQQTQELEEASHSNAEAANNDIKMMGEICAVRNALQKFTSRAEMGMPQNVGETSSSLRLCQRRHALACRPAALCRNDFATSTFCPQNPFDGIPSNSVGRILRPQLFVIKELPRTSQRPARNYTGRDATNCGNQGGLLDRLPLICQTRRCTYDAKCLHSLRRRPDAFDAAFITSPGSTYRYLIR